MGAGFLGKSIYYSLSKRNIPVVLFSRNLPDDLLPGNYSGRIEEIEKHSHIFDRVTTVIHTIHTTVPYTSYLDPGYDYESNVIPFRKFITQCTKREIRKFIYISSGGAIYGKPVGKNDIVTEKFRTKPISAYGKSKLANEIYLLSKKKYFADGIIILRPSNVYGIGQNLSVPQGIVGKMFSAALSNNCIEVWGDGNSKKDYLYMEDFVSGINQILNNNIQKIQVIYNISSGKSYSINEIIKMIEIITKRKIKIIYGDRKKFDVDSISLSNKLFSKTFKWQPKWDMKQGLQHLFELMKNLNNHYEY
ncbi:MAG: NAD-dependent epimerase/dehydratase family protein [Bacteroidetes bacterium]|nr:NAD-dependent epimerase/dehydratase family protein [Bacteroidota bacterium]